jgi:trk system potassium uptake protein
MSREKLDRVREEINLRLYKHKHIVVNVLPIVSAIVSVVTLASIIYYIGFPKTHESYKLTWLIIQISFAFYVLKYLLNILYNFSPVQFIKQTWPEAVINSILIVNFISSKIFAFHIFTVFCNFINQPELVPYSIIFIQFYVFIIVSLEVGKASPFISSLHVGPAALLTLSFVVLIFSGAGLLMLPEMTVGHNIRFIDALFTSTSACCVTGLIVQDTATYFTTKGHIIIMLLIQAGGLSIISFATFFATLHKKAGGVKYMSIVKDFFSVDKMSDTKVLLRQIIYFSITIEFIGTVLLFIFWYNNVEFHSFRQRVFFSLFHSISAFNNAGLALFSNNLYEGCIRYSYMLQLTIAALIFFGGIGFIAMQDMFNFKNIRQRMKHPWLKLKVNTRVALVTSILLIIGGAIAFYLLERNNVMTDRSMVGKIVTSIFQSVTTRTAGFNTVDFSVLGQPILILMIVLMFIGASPGSTGGGIKTTTFAVIFKSALATIRGKKNVEMYRHSISFDLIDKAYSIALFSILLIFISSVFLCITDPEVTFLKLLFDEVSAFGTVGLSTGITPFLSDGGKSILVFTMFTGRIGPLTLALVLSRRVIFTKYKYSSANILVG